MARLRFIMNIARRRPERRSTTAAVLAALPLP
jgi:hypothetical protein